MEISAYTLPCSKLLSTRNSSPLCFMYLRSHVQNCYFSAGNNKILIKRDQFNKITTKQQRNFGAIRSSVRGSVAAGDTETWLLEPIGDGDYRHIGFQVPMPGAFEIASNAVTVGRLPGKADLVIPVATVSGVHARIQKKGRNLLITDLDSTNGTFIGERRLKPGVSVLISSGSSVAFGDIHLAMFRVSKLDNTEASRKSDEIEPKLENGELEQSKVNSESLESSIISKT